MTHWKGQSAVELLQQQVQQLSHQQIQSVELLQLGRQELEYYLEELAQENPMLEMEEPPQEGPDRVGQELLNRLTWLEDNDYQNCYYQHMDAEELSPLAQVGTSGGLEETLVGVVTRQLDRRREEAELSALTGQIAAWLDGDGYLRVSPAELARCFGAPLHEVERALTLLRSLEPAGIGACDLGQCLALQLERIGERGPALAIVQEYLEPLARGQLNTIARALSISQAEVRAAAALIRALEPRPGAMFESGEPVCYVRPDVMVEEENGRFVAHVSAGAQKGLHINRYYRTLLENSEDEGVQRYLREKLQQAEGVLYAVGQRECTLLRCAQALVNRQQAFFHCGLSALRPVTMGELAQELGVHESTVSRTVRDKFIQCPQGILPMRCFFSGRVLPRAKEKTEVSGPAARAMLAELIAKEDKGHPLSDQKLAERMHEAGCPISRRTVTKYREELQLPNTSARRR